MFLYIDGTLLWKIRTANRNKIGCVAGSINTTGYYRIRVNGVSILRHRIIYVMFHGSIPDGYQIDHKDNDRGNDKIENLRLATHGQNKQNSVIHKNNSTGYKGVYYNKNNNKFYASIMDNKKIERLGFFETPQLASKAYNEASLRLHKEFSINKPTS